MFQSEKAVDVIYDAKYFNEFIGGTNLGFQVKKAVREKDLCKGSIDES